MDKTRISKECDDIQAASQIKNEFYSIEFEQINIQFDDEVYNEQRNIVAYIQCIIIGPKYTVYQGGKYDFRILFKSDFPNSPPIFCFETLIFNTKIKLSSNKYRSMQIDLFKSFWNSNILKHSNSYQINS